MSKDGYNRVITALTNRDVANFNEILNGAADFETVVTRPAETRLVEGPEEYDFEKDPTGQLNVFKKGAAKQEYIEAQFNRKVVKTGEQVCLEELNKAFPTDPQAKMAHILDVIFTKPISSSDDVTAVSKLVAWAATHLFKDTQQAFFELAQDRARGVQNTSIKSELTTQLAQDSPKGQWEKYSPTIHNDLMQLKALADWLIANKYLVVNDNKLMFNPPADRGHRGMMDIAQLLVKLNTLTNWDHIGKLISNIDTMPPQTWINTFKSQAAIDFIPQLHREIDGAIAAKRSSVTSNLGRGLSEMAQKYTWSSSSSVQATHTGTSTEMFNQWDQIKAQVQAPSLSKPTLRKG